MKLQVRVLSGALAGHTEVFSKSYLGIGRHPASDLRFDAERDLEVSARHAAVLLQGADWILRDMGSRNGTFVNGHRITGDTKLDDTDQIQFGPAGPAVEIRLVSDGTADGVIAAPTQAVAPATPATPTSAPRQTSGHRRTESTTQRIRVEVRRQTQKHRWLTAGLLIVLGAGAGGFFLYSRQQSAQREREIAALQARTDSVLAAADRAINQLQGEVQGLGQALQRSQQQVSSLQTALSSARRSGNTTRAANLEQQLADATQSLQYQQLAAQVDYRTIVAQNQRAVALVYVKFASGQVFNGTAFAVTPEGILITNRHVVAGEDGTQRAVELGVQFADSDQFFRARVLAISAEADLAAIKVDVRGGVPTVRALNQRPDTLSQGDPVAMIGFPLGTDLDMDRSSRDRTIARTTFTAGTVSKVLETNLQIDGYSAVGGSGSPVFDRNGEVVSVLYGSPQGSGGRVIYTVPASHVMRLLQQVRQ